MEPDQQIVNLLQKELSIDENIIWAGRPEEKIYNNLSAYITVPFGVFWLVSAFAWLFCILYVVKNIAPGPLGIVCGIIVFLSMIAIGVYVSVGKALVRRYKSKHTLYAITNKRLIVMVGLRRRKIMFTFLKDVRTITKSIETNGIGSISFGYGEVSWSLFSRWPISADTSALMFTGIKDIDTVYKITDELISKTTVT